MGDSVDISGCCNDFVTASHECFDKLGAKARGGAGDEPDLRGHDDMEKKGERIVNQICDFVVFELNDIDTAIPGECGPIYPLPVSIQMISVGKDFGIAV